MINTDKIKIGGGSPCFIIAEVAQAHDGSLGTAHAFIDAAAKTGADAVKFQTHIASEESSIHEPWRVKFSKQDETRYDYWKRMEFTPGQWLGLKQHADEAGLIFLSSPFSIAAVRLLEDIGVPAWKVASGEVTSLYLIEEIIKTKKPVIISSGMSYLEELDICAKMFKDNAAQWAIMECTTAYPAKPQQIDLTQMMFYRKRYDCAAGLSDHSGTIYPALAAAALGADMIEAHICLSKDSFGPDVSASLTPGEFTDMVNGVRFIGQMITAAPDNDKIQENKTKRTSSLEQYRKMFGKGIIARDDIKKGEKFSMENIAFVKPAMGIGASQWKKVLAGTAVQDIAAGTFIEENMLTEDS